MSQTYSYAFALVQRTKMGAAKLPYTLTVGLFFLWLFGNGAAINAAERTINSQDPALVLQAYLRATYARDFVDAYRVISSADRKVRDLNRYVQQRGPFNGFTLELARKLSESVEIKTVQRQETPILVQTIVKYKVPDPKKLSGLLLNWDPYRLNSLSAAERKQILDAIEKKARDGSLDMSEGEEKFELTKEGGEWRVFLNWAAGIKIPLRLDLSKSAGLDVTLSKSEIVAQPGDLFEVILRITNRTDQPVTARIGHLVEPNDVADYLDFVQCGFLLPATIGPAQQQEFSGTYLLRGTLPEGVRQLNLTYDFRLLK
jgi:hypothetical protein